MIVLLAAGIGVCIVGLLAIGFGIPISDTSFGNALLIAGVVILCTGLILVGMWLVARELVGLMKLVVAQGVQGARPAVPPRLAHPFAAPVAEHPGPNGGMDRAASPPPWADEAAARAKPVPAPDVQPAEPAPPPPAPDRPARRNLLFATKRRDKDEAVAAAATPSPALEAEPKVSFENAWPNPARSNGAADRQEPATADANEPAPTDQAKPDLPPGVTVMKSGVVDGMAYTLYSDGSIEAQFAGENPIRFASFDALRAHVEQQRQ
jgi:hypothetical protein